jgi:hypothetical protein
MNLNTKRIIAALAVVTAVACGRSPAPSSPS